MMGAGFDSGAVIRDLVANHMHAMQQRWTRLEAADCVRICTVGELAAAVEVRYPLPRERARAEVEAWLRDVGHRPAPILPTERVVRETVTFVGPFFVEGTGRQHSPGTFEIETLQELIEGLSFPAYRTVSTSIVLPLSSGLAHSYELARIDPAVVQAARRTPEVDPTGEQVEVRQ